MQRWDIFCSILDNYGDIGVCWRLARQLAHEHDVYIRLWIDDLNTAKKLIAPLQPQLARQTIDNVEIAHWDTPFADISPHNVGNVVVEAFGCTLPQNFIAAMAQTRPIWLNLEYLSAEHWVEDYHLQPSIHPQTGLKKTFFMPGFIPATGGLLREAHLLKTRDDWHTSRQASAFLQSFSAKKIPSNTINISIFCYPQAPILPFLHSLATTAQTPINVFITRMDTLPPLESLAPNPHLNIVHLPFLSAQDYDRLLWSCDINIVRGEDSWIRALWSGKPFIWQPYIQQDGAHWKKLAAFLAQYGDIDDTEIFKKLSLAWSNNNFDTQHCTQLLHYLPQLTTHARQRTWQYAQQTDLASQLVKFAQNTY